MIYRELLRTKTFYGAPPFFFFTGYRLLQGYTVCVHSAVLQLFCTAVRREPRQLVTISSSLRPRENNPGLLKTRKLLSFARVSFPAFFQRPRLERGKREGGTVWNVRGELDLSGKFEGAGR